MELMRTEFEIKIIELEQRVGGEEEQSAAEQSAAEQRAAALH